MKFLLGILFLSSLAAAAGLDFPQIEKEIQAPADAKTVSTEFEFKNPSDQPVTIAKTDASCSCMKIQVDGDKMTYQPGESGVIRATFDMGNFSGDVDKAILVWLKGDAAEKPSFQLKVHVHIPVLVSLSPKTLKWDLGSKPEQRAIRIEMRDSKPIKITGVNSSSKGFQYELKTIEDGKIYDLLVTPENTASVGIAIFRIQTDCEIERHRLQQAFAMVRKPAAGETSTP